MINQITINWRSISLCAYYVKKQSNFHHSAKVQQRQGCWKNKAKYELQTVQVNNQNFAIFYNGSCGDFASRYNVVTRLSGKQDFKRGVIGGPHQVFNNIGNHQNLTEHVK